MNLAFPTLQGTRPSWVDIAIKCSLAEGPLFDMADCKAIDWSDTSTVGEQRAGGRVMGFSTGSATRSGSITFYRSGFQQALSNMAAIAPKRGSSSLVGLVYFDLQIQHTPPGSIEIYETALKRCRFKDMTFKGTEGDDVDTVDVPLLVTTIVQLVNGKEIELL